MAKRLTSGVHFLLISLAAVSFVPDIGVALSLSVAAVPAIFIFGDSTADVGTNNFLNVSKLIKANFKPNGIDYPYSIPTGRFSNGYNTVDQIVRMLGYKRSPPSFFSLLNHSSTFEAKILQGVNFASGGSGILNTTGRTFNNFLSLGKQIEQFSTVQANITNIRGPAATATLLSNSLFLISVGSNDIFEYLQLQDDKPSHDELLATLNVTYHDHLKSLYDLGARKFGIISIPPIGCCPFQRAVNTSTTDSCFDEANEIAEGLYYATKALLEEMKSELQGMTYSLGNVYDMTMTVIDNPLAFGFNDVKNACCGNATLPCNESATFCPNRDEYLFWDRFHPSQRTSELAALTLYGGSTRFVVPFNFSTLVEGAA